MPLIKRDGVFVEASWDEAFTEINRRLPPLQAALGKHSVAAIAGNPSAHKIGLLLYFARLSKALGTRNIFSASTLDQMPKQLSSGLLFHRVGSALRGTGLARASYATNYIANKDRCMGARCLKGLKIQPNRLKHRSISRPTNWQPFMLWTNAPAM